MEEFNKMSDAEKTRYNTASKAERKQMTIEFRANQPKAETEPAPIPGAEVERSETAPADPEAQTRRAARKARREAEIARMKDYANNHRAKDAGVGSNLELHALEEYSPDAGTNVGNNQEFKNKAMEVYMKADAPTEAELVEEYGEQTGKAVAEIVDELDYRKEHFKTHYAYDDRKEWRTDKRQQLDDGVKRRDFRNNNTLVKNDKVKEYIEQNFKTEDGKIDIQKLKDFVFQFIGTDFEVNYGIHRKHNGGFGQDE